MAEELNRINSSAPSVINVCIDCTGGGNLSGRLYHKYQKDAVLFSSVTILIRDLEALFDWIDFPQSSTRARSFADRGRKIEKKEAVQVADTKDILGHKGDKATFVVHVRYRQNATWQGDVLWADKRQKLHFRSALELLKLIDSALDEEEEEALCKTETTDECGNLGT